MLGRLSLIKARKMRHNIDWIGLVVTFGFILVAIMFAKIGPFETIAALLAMLVLQGGKR